MLIWRIDDDEIAEPNTLEILLSNMSDEVGAVAGYAATGSRNVFIGAGAGAVVTGNGKFEISSGYTNPIMSGDISSGAVTFYGDLSSPIAAPMTWIPSAGQTAIFKGGLLQSINETPIP